MRRTLNEENLKSYITGSTLLSTGGGGIPPSEERFYSSIEKIMDKDEFPVLIDSSDLPSDVYIIEHSGVGGGIQAEIRKKYSLTPGADPYYERWVRGFNTKEWIDKFINRYSEIFPLSSWSRKPSDNEGLTLDSYFSNSTGIKAYATVIGEIGPNGFYELLNAAENRLPIVDGDMAGYRAVPEISLSTLNIHEIDPGKVMFSSAWGDIITVEKTLSYQRLEDIARHLAISSGGAISGIHAIKSADLKKSVVLNSISKTMEIGESIKSYQLKKSGIDHVLKTAGGSIIFEGKVDNFIRDTKDSFHIGDIFLTGVGNYHMKELRIWFKNENHISWLNNKPYVCSPDLICVIDKYTGLGLPNAFEREWVYGREVYVVGIPAWKKWYSPRGLQIFNPRHFGFDIEFKPIEDLTFS